MDEDLENLDSLGDLFAVSSACISSSESSNIEYADVDIDLGIVVGNRHYQQQQQQQQHQLNRLHQHFTSVDSDAQSAADIQGTNYIVHTRLLLLTTISRQCVKYVD